MKPFQSSRHVRKGLTMSKVEIISDVSATAKEAAATSKLAELLQTNPPLTQPDNIANVLKDPLAAAEKAKELVETMYTAAVSATAARDPKVRVVGAPNLSTSHYRFKLSLT
jgi:hypothetical protein